MASKHAQRVMVSSIYVREAREYVQWVISWRSTARQPNDAVLAKWVDDLIKTAEKAFNTAKVRVISRVGRVKRVADLY